MSNQQSLPIHLHTADYFEKTKALRAKSTWSRRIWILLFAAVLTFLVVMLGPLNAHAALL